MRRYQNTPRQQAANARKWALLKAREQARRGQDMKRLALGDLGSFGSLALIVGGTVLAVGVISFVLAPSDVEEGYAR